MKQPTFNQRLKETRSKAGMTGQDVIFESRVRLPKPMWIAASELSRLENHVAEEAADWFVIAFLASLYGVTTAELSQVAEERRRAVMDVLTDFRCSSVPAREDAGTRPRARGEASSAKTLTPAAA